MKKKFNLENTELYNETNTYDFNSYKQTNNFYNLTKKNKNIVTKNDVLLTFFIHGLGGNAGQFGSDGSNGKNGQAGVNGENG